MTTNNNNLAARLYTKEYKQLLTTVYGVRRAFSNALAPLQIVDGVQNNDKAFFVKTNATPVVVGEYKTGTNDVLGNGSGAHSRFGDITEVIYTDTPADYTYNYAINEGLDRHTVNNDLDAAVADRLTLHSEAVTRKQNKNVGKFLSDNAGKTLALTANDKENIKKLFAQVDKYLTDNEVLAPVTVYVRPELYGILNELKNTVSTSGFSTDFTVEKTPSTYFESDVMALVVPNGVVIPFIGIQTARAVEAIDFDGKLLQGAQKGGTFILDDNKKAVIKVTGTPEL